MKKLLYPVESYEIIGACFNVYKRMGCGFLEAIYQECLEIEFTFKGISNTKQKLYRIVYRGQELRRKFQPDFICYDKIIVELKAVSQLKDEHQAQVLNYLNATGHKLALLVNFGHYPKLEYKRLILTKNTHSL